MAKRSLFWGQASGKLGETVLYRAGGEQRTRTYVAKIKNPKTLAQMENRLSMLNFASIYRSLKPVLSASFPNRPTAQSGFNAFVKANKSVNAPVISKEAAQKGLCAPANILMSEGYLTQYGLAVAEASAKGNVIGQNVNFDLEVIIDALSANDPYPVSTAADLTALFDGIGAPADAKITLIYATYKDEGWDIKTTQFKRGMTDFEMQSAAVGLALYKNTAAKTNVIGASVQAREDMACCIISWTDANGKLQTSTSRMIGVASASTYINQFTKGGEIYNQVLDAYGFNEGSVLG